MSLHKTEVSEIVAKFAKKPGDTGSPEVQIALLTARVNHLTSHFKSHSKDNHSRRGLLLLVGQRRRLLRYLHRTNSAGYKTLIGELGIRK
jgi:small subunit ribosomal protein S15